VTVTAASLKAAHPEFDTAGNDLVTSMIASAELEVGEGAWGDRYDLGVELLACHYLATCPDGRMMRVDPAGVSVTFYGQQYARLKVVAACGLGRVI